MATPPCQGMSTAGVQDENDERNKPFFICHQNSKAIKTYYIFSFKLKLLLLLC